MWRKKRRGKEVEIDSQVVEEGKGKREEGERSMVEGGKLPGNFRARGAWMSMHSCLLPSSLVNYVREQLVCSVALMVKRATLEVDKQKLFGSILTTVSQLLTVNVSSVGWLP